MLSWSSAPWGMNSAGPCPSLGLNFPFKILKFHPAVSPNLPGFADTDLRTLNPV